MLSLRILLAILGAWSFNLTLAYADQRATSSSTHLTTIALSQEDVLSSLISSKKALFTFTPPFTSKTFVSISLPECLPHNPTLTPLGCTEPSTNLAPTTTLPSTPTSLPLQVSPVVWKTVVVTVTGTTTIWRLSGKSPETMAQKNQVRGTLDGNSTIFGVGSESGDRVLAQAVTTVTSVVDSNNKPQRPETSHPPPADLKGSSASTTTSPTAASEQPTMSDQLSQLPPAATPCSFNTAHDCIELGGITFIMGGSGGPVAAPTDGVLPSSAMTVDPNTMTKPLSPKTSPGSSSAPSSQSTSTASYTPSPSFKSRSMSSSVPHTSSILSTSTASTQSPVARSSGLRKAKNPWLILVICCVGAVMFEAGIWTDKNSGKPQTIVQCNKCGKHHTFVDQDLVEDGPDFKPEYKRTDEVCKRAERRMTSEATTNDEGTKFSEKDKEYAAVEDNRGPEELLTDWNLV